MESTHTHTHTHPGDERRGQNIHTTTSAQALHAWQRACKMIDTHVYLHASHTQRTPRSLAPPRSSPPPPLQPPPHTQENVLVLIFVFPDAPVCKLPFLNASAFSCALSSSCLLNSVYSVVGTRNAANIDNANTGNSVGSTCLPSSPPPSAIVAQLLKNE